MYSIDPSILLVISAAIAAAMLYLAFRKPDVPGQMIKGMKRDRH